MTTACKGRDTCQGALTCWHILAEFPVGRHKLALVLTSIKLQKQPKPDVLFRAPLHVCRTLTSAFPFHDSLMAHSKLFRKLLKCEPMVLANETHLTASQTRRLEAKRQKK